jgi:GNAT superfamily N-acetyltransferase
MVERLDNVVWSALCGSHAHLAVGRGAARRYPADYTALIGFADMTRPDFDATTSWWAPGERLYCIGWSGAAPDGWRVEAETTIVKMTWPADRGPGTDPGFAPRRLGPGDAAEAQALAALTQPGPFGPRTIELGEYFGCHDAEGRLIAMAGERMHAAPWREVSAICTHPEARGQGYAARLTRHLLARARVRGERSFLHVMHGNAGARALYRRLGFEDYREMVVRVVSRTGG